jgi:hypothetical protein
MGDTGLPEQPQESHINRAVFQATGALVKK